MDNKSKPWALGPHFVDPESNEPFAVAPGMRFRKPNGAVVVAPQPEQPEPPEPKKD